MKREAEIRDILIENTIRLIAEGGFEKATTKEITHSGAAPEDFKMNEVYIYRLFGSKEKLYEEAFSRLDRELYTAMLAAVKTGFDAVEGATRDKFYALFLQIWSFLLQNETRCRCFVRFYYSIYFKGAALLAHKRLFDDLESFAAPIFKREADVSAILHCVFTTMLDFAIRVYNGDLEDSDINRPHVFNVLYCMMMTYFKEEAKFSRI